MSRPLIILVAAILFLQPFALGQSDSASISGRIADESGSVLVGAQVNVTNVETEVGVSSDTNADGIYVVRGLRPGPYRVSVDKEGFRSILLTDLILNVQDALG